MTYHLKKKCVKELRKMVLTFHLKYKNLHGHEFICTDVLNTLEENKAEPTNNRY